MIRPCLSLLCFASLGGGLGVAEEITAVLDATKSPIFGCVRSAGKVALLDAESHFNRPAKPDRLSFESSNAGMLAVHGYQGVLEGVTSYRAAYTTLTGNWPGVWTAKDHTTSGPFAFRLIIDGMEHDLAKVEWDARTELIDNLLPVTTLAGPSGRFRVRLLTCAPVSADGRQRPRGVIYGLELTNTGTIPLEVTVVVPSPVWGRKAFDGWGEQDKNCSLEVALGDRSTYDPRPTVSLAPGTSRWVPVIITDAGSDAVATINAQGTVAWIRDTLTYERRLLGRLTMPDHPWVAAFYERNLLQAQHAIAMDPEGRIAGSNWGSVPVTRMTWTKDFFHAALPLMGQDPAFATDLIAWFDAHGERPPGIVDRADAKPKAGATAGGISHSISLAVAAPLLAGVLYEHTGDAEFLRRHPAWKTHWADVLTRLLATCHPGSSLMPTRFISDGPVTGAIHVGSNACVAKALAAYARLLREVWQDPVGAKPYADAATKMVAELKQLAPTGPWHEAYGVDGTSAGAVSDGEESDTTLMPFYGLLTQDDPTWQATMAFAASPANTKFTANLHAIAWEGSVLATAPGYNKPLAAATGTDALFGEHGAFTELRRQADGDGSLWWWPYGMNKNPVYGEVQRAFMGIGKAAWFSGAYATLFPNRFLGLRWDAPTATLILHPRPELGRITWEDLPLGGSWRVDVATTGSDLTVRNRSAGALSVNGTAIPAGGTARLP
jgi:hypothetical protein